MDAFKIQIDVTKFSGQDTNHQEKIHFQQWPKTSPVQFSSVTQSCPTL